MLQLGRVLSDTYNYLPSVRLNAHLYCDFMIQLIRRGKSWNIFVYTNLGVRN